MRRSRRRPAPALVDRFLECAIASEQPVVVHLTNDQDITFAQLTSHDDDTLMGVLEGGGAAPYTAAEVQMLYVQTIESYDPDCADLDSM